MSDELENYRQNKVLKLCREARELCKPSSLAAPGGSASKELQLADALCEKVGLFLFYRTEGRAKEMSDAAEAYAKSRQARRT